MDAQVVTSGGGDLLKSSNRSVAHHLTVVGYTRQEGLRVDARQLRNKSGQEEQGGMNGWST